MGTPNIATFDSGSASWACFQQQCMTAATACGSDTCCDIAIAKALQCAQDAGNNSNVMGCFTSNYMAGGTPATNLVTCLVMHETGDAACPMQYAAPTEGGTEAGGEAGSSEGGGTEAGGGDAGTTDAPTGG